MDNQTRDSIRIAAVQMFAQKRAGFLQDAGKYVAEQWGKLNPTAQGAVIGGLGGGAGSGLLAYLTGRNVLTGILGGGAAGAGVGAGIQYLRHRGDKPGAQPPAAIAPATQNEVDVCLRLPHYTATPEGGALLKADRDLIAAALSEQGLGKAVTPEQIKALSRMREVAQYLQSNGYKDLGGDVLFKTLSGLEN